LSSPEGARALGATILKSAPRCEKQGCCRARRCPGRRLAPLWEIIPIWKAEPKKHWQKLEAGDYDWSHIAMQYWPERVREKCSTNKSYAIAHGHEDWFTE
jgi:hypothetical protein